MNSLQELLSIYDEIELAILYDWLELPRPAPLKDIELGIQHENDAGEGGPVRLLRSAGGYLDENASSNAVARIVLTSIQHRLPQWAAVRADGQVRYARAYRPARHAQVEPLPQYLFTINWADSGPGFSWPEAYHATFLPGFDRYVVTASQDSPDVHGYTDEAIGHFGKDEEREASIGRVIRDWWSWQADTGQPRWAYLFGVGEIDSDTATAWGDAVWPVLEPEAWEEES
jgi:hypothetical protein